jgi:mRNA-degrading endonuclease RelE of RelBE toxin-antitoxin system
MATEVVDRAVADGEDAMMQLIVSAVAAKDLAALPGRDRRALFDKVQAFAADPFATHPAARPMRGRSDRIRVRHGDWRALCRIDSAAATVTLERVGHRREIYR